MTRTRRQAFGRAALVVAVALLAGAQAFATTLDVDTDPVVLGGQETVGVEIRAPGRGGVDTLRLAVNVGRIDAIERVGDDEYRATYHLPDTRFPQIAIFAVWHETGEDRREITVFRLPLHGVTRIPVTTDPGSTVFAHVGGRRFGPVRADASGRAVVPIHVAPGLRHAVVEVRDPTGVPARRRVEVEVPDYNRLLAIMVPERLTTARGRSGRLEVYYVDADPVPPEDVVVIVEAGEVTRVSHGGGRYVYGFDPPRVRESRRVHISISVKDDDASQAEVGIEIDVPDPVSHTDLHAGLRAGIAHSMAELVGPRLSLELSLPVQMEVVDLVASASLGWGTGAIDGGSTLVHLVPFTFRASQQLLRRGAVTTGVGVGATAVFGLRRTPATGAAGSGIGLGAHLYGEAAFDLGVGSLFVEMGFGFAPIPTGGPTLQAGGLNVDAGLRIPLF